MEINLMISTDGEDFKEMICSVEDSIKPNEKEYTAIDKHLNHIVMVDWLTKEWMTFNVHPSELDNFEVGKKYVIRIDK